MYWFIWVLSRNNEINLITRKEFSEGVVFTVKSESSSYDFFKNFWIFTNKDYWVLQSSHTFRIVSTFHLQPSWKSGYRPVDTDLLSLKSHSCSCRTGDCYRRWWDNSFVCECMVRNINIVHNGPSNAPSTLKTDWVCETRVNRTSS